MVLDMLAAGCPCNALHGITDYHHVPGCFYSDFAAEAIWSLAKQLPIHPALQGMWVAFLTSCKPLCGNADENGRTRSLQLRPASGRDMSTPTTNAVDTPQEFAELV